VKCFPQPRVYAYPGAPPLTGRGLKRGSVPRIAKARQGAGCAYRRGAGGLVCCKPTLPQIANRRQAENFRRRRGVPGSRPPIAGCAATRGRGMPRTEAEVIQEIADIAASYVPKVISWVTTDFQCESPIERVMAAALVSAFRFLTPIPTRTGKPHADPNKEGSAPAQISIFPQAIIGEWRADFLIISNPYYEWGSPIRIVVECDGHEFHERTKHQAARDRGRDRKMQQLGYVVLRFTGSEIWADPMRCAHEVASCLLNLADDQRKRSLEARP